MSGAGCTGAVLSVNAGSSSLKFGVYECGAAHARLSGAVEGLEPGGSPMIRLGTGAPHPLPAALDGHDGHTRALQQLGGIMSQALPDVTLQAVAHRIVHGGDRYTAPVVVDDDVLAALEALSPLAPLHQPHNVAGVRALRRAVPGLPQVACFDTAFHATLPEMERRFALPAVPALAGVRRYGFHGLSYQYLVQTLRPLTSRLAGRAVLAHLGNGASLCATRDGVSQATTMGFSALDGLVMGTRSGSVDAGVLLHLMRQGWDADRLEDLLYRQSGLRGLSGLSADMRTLRASSDPRARLAVDLFRHRLVRECGALAAVLGGLDLLAFTGGIGEHDAGLRRDVCETLSWLGIVLDEAANEQAVGDDVRAVHAPGSPVEVWVVPTDEGRVAAGQAWALLAGPAAQQQALDQADQAARGNRPERRGKARAPR